MTDPAPRSVLPLMGFFAAGLVAIGMLRWATLHVDRWDRFAGVPSPAYVVLVIVVALSARRRIGWSRMGFGVPFNPVPHIALGLAGAAAVVLAGLTLEPMWTSLLGVERDVSRFDAASTLPGLLMFIAISWTFAAFGEEFAFRGVLFGGLRAALGNGGGATAVALVLQAFVFGLIHTYQGPAGVAGTMVSGLIYGSLVLLARGSLWPAVLAHGLGNTYGLVSLYLANG